MPQSQRTAEESGDYKKKRKSKPTNKRRAERQEARRKYAHAREDAQLLGLIETTPEGALAPEAVDPADQTKITPPPSLIKQAISQGWAVPEERKRGMVDELMAIVENPDMPAKVKVAAFNALRAADQAQFERDNPDLIRSMRGHGGALTGGTTIIGAVNNIQNNIDAATAIRDMVNAGKLGLIEEVRTPVVTVAPSDSGQRGEVGASATPEDDEQRLGEGVADTKQPTSN